MCGQWGPAPRAGVPQRWWDGASCPHGARIGHRARSKQTDVRPEPSLGVPRGLPTGSSSFPEPVTAWPGEPWRKLPGSPGAPGHTGRPTPCSGRSPAPALGASDALWSSRGALARGLSPAELRFLPATSAPAPAAVPPAAQSSLTLQRPRPPSGPALGRKGHYLSSASLGEGHDLPRAPFVIPPGRFPRTHLPGAGGCSVWADVHLSCPVPRGCTWASPGALRPELDPG